MSLIQHTRDFIDWWLAGLLIMVPESLRNRIIEYPDRLIVEIVNREISMTYYRGYSNEIIDRKVVNQEDELEKADTIQWLNQIKNNYMECIVLLPKDSVLVKSLSLPSAGEKNLNDILGFEMDRQTPFTPDQVYFDSVITSSEAHEDKISLDLYVVTRSFLDKVLADLKQWPLKINSVTLGAGDVPGKINFLPLEARATNNSKINPLTLATCVTAFILIIAALYVPLFHKQGVLEELERQVNESRALAREVEPLITERENILKRTMFLDEKKRNTISVIEILNELTNLLPDNTYLNRLTIRENEVQIHGESDTATSIIQLLENSDYFENAQLRSPVTKNNATDKERFHFSATLVKGVTS